MNIIDQLITDRSQYDITHDTEKAYIDGDDLNRIERACDFLADLFGVTIETKTWRWEDYRTVADMKRIKENIDKLREAYHVKPTTPRTPSVITYESIYQANNIEQILKDLYDMYVTIEGGKQRLAFRLGSDKPIGRR